MDGWHMGNDSNNAEPATAVKRPRGRPVVKTLDDHKADGTYRKDRHGPLGPEVLQYEDKPDALSVLKDSAASQSKWINNESDERAVRDGCRFSLAHAEHAANFFPRYLRHSKGRWSGKPFELLDWQRDKIIYPIFGWMRPDGQRRFRKSFVGVPKKNGKSTLASGIGLYMLTADGEPGPEIYSVATDRDQASIVHREALNMVEASEELQFCLKINWSTHNLRYKKLRGWYRALSSTASGKEGLNIHCSIIDELHAWRGVDLWNSLQYGYRSRMQPLQFVITTAGDDTESVCYKLYERAKAILSGDITDQSFFACVYEADEIDDWSDPAVWRKANPSLGSTIIEEDFGRDADEAKERLSTEVSFKRYSLNLWAKAASPWLRATDWSSCGDSYNDDDMNGRDCWIGLDLAKTRDMTAGVAVFNPTDQDPLWRLLAYFWMPEDTARDPQRRGDYEQWAADGWLTLTPGNVCDYGYVKKFIGESLASKFNVRELVYDPWGAEHLTQEISDEYGIERVSFGQTITNFAEPTSEFERLVVSRMLRHNDNPILSWQAGHVTVRADVNNNKRPVKPPQDDYRKIDGIVGAVMGVGRALSSAPEAESVYKSRGLIVL